MGIPRTGSRNIVVAGARLRWLVSSPRGWIENAGPWAHVLASRRLTVVVQHENGIGAKLVARVPVYRRAFRRDEVETPLREGVVALATPSQQRAVTPALVRLLVEEAMRHGWRTTVSGRDFVLSAEAIEAAMRAAMDTRLRGLLVAVRAAVDGRLLTELASVGELGLMVEVLCDQLAESDVSLAPDVLAQIAGMVTELGVDRDYLDRIHASRRSAATPEVMR